jgi:hypothetical protein
MQNKVFFWKNIGFTSSLDSERDCDGDGSPIWPVHVAACTPQRNSYPIRASGRPHRTKIEKLLSVSS